VRTIVKKTSLSVAAAAAALIAATSAGFAAELPTYQSGGFPISVVQAQVLERANVREVPSSAVSPHQLNAPAPRKKVASATGTPTPTTTGSSLR
jgi:hypothetical protein